MKNDKNTLKVLALLALLLRPHGAQAFEVIEDQALMIHYASGLASAGKEVSNIYPAIRAELESAFGLAIDFNPTVILMNDQAAFRKQVGSDHFAAYARPQKQRIVIDYSKMATRPFNLDMTLKHELAHLLLHRHIPTDRLPKWLDEGLAQWASGGFAEILINRDGGLLRKAGLSGQLIPLKNLDHAFPEEKTALLLAYEQSKSIVSTIDENYGADALRQILTSLQGGDEIEAAFEKNLGVSVGTLEKDWQKQLKNELAWWVYLGGNLSLFLFSLAGVVTALGFVRFWIKKRNYIDDEEEAVLPYGVDDFDNLDKIDEIEDNKY